MVVTKKDNFAVARGPCAKEGPILDQTHRGPVAQRQWSVVGIERGLNSRDYRAIAV